MTPCPTCGYAIDAATLLNYGDANRMVVDRAQAVIRERGRFR